MTAGRDVSEQVATARADEPSDAFAPRPGSSAPSASFQPLIPAAVALILGIVISEYVGAFPAAAVGAFFGALGFAIGCFLIVALQTGTNRSPDLPLACLILAALLAGFARHQAAIALPGNHITHILSNERTLAKIAGYAITAPQSSSAERRNPFIPQPPPPRQRFILRAAELRNAPTAVPIVGDLRVSVDAQWLAIQPGDFVELTGWIYRPRAPQNPGETDWARVFYLQGISAGISVPGVDLVHIERPAASWFDHFRNGLRVRAAGLLLDPEARVGEDEAGRAIEAMVLGQRSAVSRRVDEAFIHTGTVHILSVSGSHVGMIGVTVWFVARRILRRGRRTTAGVTAAILLLYALLAEPSAPIWRATLMGLFACGAIWLGRPVASLNWLACSALVVLAVQPLDLFRAGFQLSFLQVAVLFVVTPAIYMRVIYGARPLAIADMPPDADTFGRLLLRWAYRGTLGLFIASATAWTAALPLTLYHFGFITPLGVFQSVLLTPLFGVVIVLGFIALLLGAVLPVLSGVGGTVVNVAMAWLLRTVESLAAWPASYFEVTAPPAWLVVASYLCGATAVWLWLRHRAEVVAEGRRAAERREGPVMPAFGRVRTALIAACLGTLIATWTGWRFVSAWPTDEYALHVLAIGSGSAAYLAAPSGRAMVFDVGTLHDFDAGQTLRAALRATHAGPLAAVTISHSDFDHYSGLPDLLRHGGAQRALVNPYFLERIKANKSLQLLSDMCGGPPAFVPLAADDELTLDAAHCDVLWPPTDLPPGLATNDQSLVFRVTVGDCAILVTGDIAGAALDGLLRAADTNEIDLHADVLIAPHHGSIVRETGPFLAAVRPRAIVVSTGRDREKYRALVRETLGDAVLVYSTRDVGAVCVRFPRAGGFVVETPFAPALTGAGERGDGPH